MESSIHLMIVICAVHGLDGLMCAEVTCFKLLCISVHENFSGIEISEVT